MSMFVRGTLRFVIAAAALTFCAASHAGPWYVDKSNASGIEDGASWSTAFSTIQPAIDAAHEDGGGEVWIAAGVYDERREYVPPISFSPSGRNYGSLVLREHVELYGGFAGSEARRVQRQVTRNRTVIDGSMARDGEYAYAVVVGASHAVLDGMIITHGVGIGGMLNLDLESIRIVNCVFTENTGNTGVGMWNNNAIGVQIDRCVFSGNIGLGTGAILSQYSTLEVLDSSFVRNSAMETVAIVYSHDTRARFLRCSFLNNLNSPPLAHITGNAEGTAGLEVIACDFVANEGSSAGAGIILNLVGEGFVLERTTFIGNRGGNMVWLYRSPDASQLIDVSISDCAFVNNAEGPPIELTRVNLDLRGCTFAGNVFAYWESNLYDSNIYYDLDMLSRIHASNCIFWNDGNSHEFLPEVEESGMLVIENSIVRGGYPGVGIIDEQPSFRNQPDGDFRLLPHSVGVDIADVATALDLDVFGTLRPQGSGPDMGAHEVRVENPTLCDAAPEIEAALGRLRFVAELYGDLDEDGLPEIASLRLLNAAACAYDTSKGFAAERAFELNLGVIDNEPFDMRILRKRDLIAALMAVGEETQRTVRDAFAEEGVVLLGSYAVVACDETGACETIFVDPAARGAVPATMDEPFPGPGDYDLDGLTNSQEWAGVISQGGGLEDFILAATDPSIRATVASASGGGCFIATAAYGTPLAGEIDVLRTLRDRRLLTNPLGAAFTDTYYRLSPPLADIIAGNHALLAVVRTSLGAGLWTIEFLTTLHGRILTLGLALILASTIRIRRRPRRVERSTSDPNRSSLRPPYTRKRLR